MTIIDEMLEHRPWDWACADAATPVDHASQPNTDPEPAGDVYDPAD